MQARDLVAAAPIRAPLLRGRQSIAALWFPTAWFDATTRAARLIACWRPGASALRFAQGDLLCYAVPIDENCDNLPGWSLRQEGSALCSAPLSDAERARLREGDVWIVLGAEVLTLYKRDAEPLDPSGWLAIDQLSLHDTYDCSAALPAPVVLDLESRPLREVLGNAVPPASHEQADFLAAMQRARKENPNRVPRARRVSANGSSRFIVGVAIAIAVIAVIAFFASNAPSYSFPWLILIFVLFRLALSGLMNREGGASATPAARPSVTPPPAELPARSKLAHPQRWRRWLAQIAMTSQLARLVGLAQARHLRRVFGLFDEGNLAEALRHAIPLDGGRGSLGQAFGTPNRRSNLDLTRAHGPSTTIDLGDELQNHLRTLYRQAFGKLDREQRFDEAVFVLAELLNAKREALDYLEKHERFAQAAELALGWDMPPDVIVRLHCLAGDWRRAVAVARRDNAFSTTVLQMEKRWPDAARRLREEWGNTLTQQGDWLGAVDAVWPVESLRAKATQWLLTAESAGGRLAARALVQRAMLLPDTLDRYAKELLELQRDGSLWRDRLAMADALMSIGRSPATQRLAALIAPAVLADHAQGHRRFEKRVLRQFVESAGDVLLQVDLPHHDWPGAQPEPASKRAEVLCLEAPEAGAHSILDAVPLDDQCYLLALGESGACVIDATGRMRARFATPAQRVVLAHGRQVALLLARRESLWRVSRLDLAQKTLVDLGVLAFDFWGTQFDGLNWAIVQGRHLRVLDTQDSLRQVVWQVTDLPGNVCALTASATLEQIVLEVDRGALQLWSYRLPQRQLTARDDLPHVDGQLQLLNPMGGVVGITSEQSADNQLCLRWRMSGKSLEFRLQTTQPEDLRLWLAGEWLVVSTHEESGYLVRWLLLATGAECARAEWPADAAPNVRAYYDEWLLFDARGRLLNFNVSSSQQQSFGLR
jgi:hypothetical protein